MNIPQANEPSQGNIETAAAPRSLKAKWTVLKVGIQEGLDIVNDTAVTIGVTALSPNGIDLMLTGIMFANSAGGYLYRAPLVSAYELAYPHVHPYLQRLPGFNNKAEKPQKANDDVYETWRQSAIEAAWPRIAGIATFGVAYVASRNLLVSAGVAAASTAIKWGIVFGLKRLAIHAERAVATRHTTSAAQTEITPARARRGQQIIQRFVPGRVRRAFGLGQA